MLAGHVDYSVAGTDAMIKKVCSYIECNKLEGHVHFLGRREDIPLLMRKSDFLVHPTRTEGFGLSLVEALHYKLPIVA